MHKAPEDLTAEVKRSELEVDYLPSTSVRL